MDADNLELIDRLSQTLLWDAEASNWKPEATWEGLLESHCNGNKDLAAAVMEYTRSQRDEAEDDQSIRAKLQSLRSPQFRPSRTIGRYEVIGLIGTGGMGEVYEVLQRGEELTFRRALKLIKTELNTGVFLDRFRSERHLLSLLRHENIIQILDDGATEDGRSYFVMEFIPSAQRLDKYCSAHRLSLIDRLRLFITVCGAIQYAHDHSVLHLDLKPSNILVSEEGLIKIVDFGLATLFTTEKGSAPYASGNLGQIVQGTPGCMSPEQQRGETLTIATDVFALGLVLHDILEDSPEYLGSPDVNKKKKIDSVILDAIRPRACDRYTSVEAFTKSVRSLIQHTPVPRSLWSRTRTLLGEHPFLAIVAVLPLLYLPYKLWQDHVLAVEQHEQEVRQTKQRQIERDAEVKTLKQSVAVLFASILPAGSPFASSVDPDVTTKAAYDLGKAGDNRTRLALGLLLVYGNDAFVKNFKDSKALLPLIGRTRLYRPVRLSNQIEVMRGARYAEAQAIFKKYFSDNSALEGLEWLTQLAAENCASVDSQLARIFYSGRGPIPKDESKAFSFAEQAVASGDPEGHFVLGNLYAIGITGKLAVNDSLAVSHWEKAAEGQSAKALFTLAEYYGAESRSDLRRDPLRGYMWANIAGGIEESQWESLIDNLYDLRETSAKAEILMISLAEAPPHRNGIPNRPPALKQSQVLAAQKMASAWRSRFSSKSAASKGFPWDALTCRQ